MGEKIRVAVIFGGKSTEHEISRLSAQSIINRLNKDKYKIIMIGITKEGKWLSYNGPLDKLSTNEWEEIAISENKKNNMQKSILFNNLIEEKDINKQIDVIFPVLHGLNGEDGTVQGLFEVAGIPYVGSGVLASALGMDKYYSKCLFEKEGLMQCKYFVIKRKQVAQLNEILTEVEDAFSYPCFVKPCNCGSSVGVNKAHNRDELIEFINTALKYDRRILIEEYIEGREIECSVLGNDEPIASIPGEIISSNEFYDYEAKYSKDSKSQIIIPARLPNQTVDKIKNYALRAFKTLDCAGLARVDFFVSKKTGDVYINELNTMPGFTEISMYPKLWEAEGLPYEKLLDKLIELAFERHKEKMNLKV